jgi:hypothetical protein
MQVALSVYARGSVAVIQASNLECKFLATVIFILIKVDNALGTSA